jgi:hypothetical protein
MFPLEFIVCVLSPVTTVTETVLPAAKDATQKNEQTRANTINKDMIFFKINSFLKKAKILLIPNKTYFHTP